MRTLIPILLVGCTPRLYTSGSDTDAWSWEEPENRWEADTPPDGTLGQGFLPGQIPPDLRLVDQHGDEVSLWQFHGKVILLDISTMWCAPCQELAQGTEHTQELFGSEDFAYITVLQENVESQPPHGEDLEMWTELFEIESSPVLADGDKTTGAAIQNGQFPAVLLIDRNLTVVERVNPPDDPTVQSVVGELLGQ